MDIAEFGVCQTAFVLSRDAEFAADQFAVAESASAGAAFAGDAESRAFHCDEQRFGCVCLDDVFLVADMHGQIELLGFDVARADTVGFVFDPFSRYAQCGKLFVGEAVHGLRTAQHTGVLCGGVFRDQLFGDKARFVALGFFVAENVDDFETVGYQRVKLGFENQVFAGFCSVKKNQTEGFAAFFQRLRHAVEGGDSAAACQRDDGFGVFDPFVMEAARRIADDQLIADFGVVKQPVAEEARFFDRHRKHALVQCLQGRRGNRVGAVDDRTVYVSRNFDILPGTEKHFATELQGVSFGVGGFGFDGDDGCFLIAGVENCGGFVDAVGLGQGCVGRGVKVHASVGNKFFESDQIHKSE